MAEKKKGAEEPKKHPNLVYENYSASGDKLERKNKMCPKCGDGTFLAAHKNRAHCGKCGYTEFQKKEE